MDLGIKEIAHAIGGKAYNDNGQRIKGVSIDTRKDVKGSLFIPIIGENYDGHQFIKAAYKGGAVCVFCHSKLDTNKPFIQVRDTTEAMLDLARWYRKRWLVNAKVVGITGSAGKTTTKDMLASIVSQKYNTVATSENLNNKYGLSLTIFGANRESEVLVLEMGMNNAGEMSELSSIATPDMCIVTNIGTAHIDNLGSRVAIFKAKTEIFDYMDKEGVGILSYDDDYLPMTPIPNKLYVTTKKEDKGCYGYDIVSHGLEGFSFKAKYKEESYNIKINYPGEFLIYNAMLALVCAERLGLSTAEVEKGLLEYTSSKDRMKITKSSLGFNLINDVYNANFESVKATTLMLAENGGKRALILGDMLGLAGKSERIHTELGHFLKNVDIDIFIFIGTAVYFTAEAMEMDNVHCFGYKKDAYKKIKKILSGVDTVLVKASRGMKFEEVVEFLQ